MTTANVPEWPVSVGILGAAGLIGSGVAAALATSGACRQLHFVDPKVDLLRAHAIDIAEAQIAAGSATTALTIADAESAPECDLVVVAASAPETPEGDRKHFLAANLRLLRALLPTLQRMAGTQGVVLLLSNPVDILADALHRLAGFPSQRIVGYSLNDSLRFRMALGREFGVHPSRVEGWVLGEHGSAQVPLFSRVRLDGRPVRLGASAEERVRADVDGWFARWSALRPGRSSGWSTPVGTLTTIDALATGAVHPASVWTGDVPDLPPTFVTLPAQLSPHGLSGVEEWNLDVAERRALRQAADSVHSTTTAALAQLSDG